MTRTSCSLMVLPWFSLLAACGFSAGSFHRSSAAVVAEDDEATGPSEAGSGSDGEVGASGGQSEPSGGSLDGPALPEPADYPTSCPSQWWGSDVTGVQGAATCGEPYDRAMLAYGNTVLEECTTLSGPPEMTHVGNEVKCCYTADENACGNSWVGPWCVSLPYFGGGNTQVDLAAISSSDVAAACATAGNEVPFASFQEGVDKLLGVWMRCDSTPSLFTPLAGPESDGIVVNADGTFHGVTRTASGALVLTPGCYQEGLWGFVSNNQLNFQTSKGTNMTFPIFEESPTRLRIDFMAVDHFVFAKVE